MNSEDVTLWLSGFKRGDGEAVDQVWQVYFDKLVRLCRRRLEGLPRRVADEEDVALSAFQSFCDGLQRGRFPKLEDRDDLWKILVTIAARKALAQHKHERARKRGGNAVRGESVFLQGRGSDDTLGGIDQFLGVEPSPETAVAVSEACEHLLSLLKDEMQRSVALLKMQGYTSEEIADQLDCTTRTVERKLAAIRDRWQQHIDHASPDPDA